MNSLTIGSRRFALVSFLIVLVLSAATAAWAYGLNGAGRAPAGTLASLNIAVAVVQDGLALMNTTNDQMNGMFVCPSDPTPGCDFSATNGIVRTNDSILYSYDYSVNVASEDITLTVTAPMGTVWNVLPAFCQAGSSRNSGDGVTTASIIVCKRGVQVSGTSESLPFTATVNGTTHNGTTLTASGTVSGPSSSSSSANAASVTVSAAPRYNLRKTYNSVSPLTLSGQPGYRIEYRALLEMWDNSTPAAFNPRYGSEALASTITFTDLVSAISPAAVLQSCAKQNDHSGSAGTIACTQAGGAGTDISATISNANSSLSQWSTAPGDGRFAVGSYQIFIFIPDTAVLTAPGQTLVTTNTLSNFDPTSVSGQSNFDAASEQTSDNSVGRSFTPLTGNFGVSFVRDYNNNSTTGFGTAVGSVRFVGPTDIFAAQISLNNNTGATLNNVAMCNVLDNSRYTVTETSPGSGVVAGNDAVVPASVEYAAGYVNANWQPTASGGNPNGMRAECSDASVVWYSSPTAVPGGVAAITKFRVRYNSLAANTTGTVRVRVQARENNYYNGQTNFNGVSIASYGLWRSDELNTTYNTNNYYAPNYPANPSGSTGARLILGRATVRVTKETESNDAVNSVATGGTIGYVLKPVLSRLGTPTPVQVVVKDVMPAGLSYIVGTAMQSGSSLEPQIVQCTGAGAPDASCAAGGRQVLIWTLNNQTPNVAIAPISFRAAADLTVVNNQTVVNTAIVATAADPSAESNRTATRSVIGASPSTLLIFKITNAPQIEVNSNYSYSVSYRNASVSNDFTNLDFIDVLPFNGDASLAFESGEHLRSPASAFSGTSTLASVSATSPSATWYFTNADPATLNISPKAAGNANPGLGGSIWCTGTSAGPNIGCGFTAAQTTAVRMVDSLLMPRGATIRAFTVNLATAGNAANDRYTNNAAGSAAELALPISSNNVPVVVLESGISGVVWFDTNGDGIRGAEETGRVDGVTVTLAGTDSHGNAVNRDTVTSGGTYSFGQLPSGSYTITFSRPGGYIAGTRDNGSDDSMDSDGDPTTLATAPIVLGVNDAKTGVDQGFFKTGLAGTVWRDLNHNGAIDGGEAGLSGLTVELLYNDSAVVTAVATDADGGYAFSDIAPGSYRVRVARGEYIASPVTNLNADDNVDGDNNGSTSGSFIAAGAITITAGNEPTLDHLTGTTTNSTLDIGLTLAPSSAGVTVGGRVLDRTGRGIQWAVLTLVDSHGNVRYSVANAAGHYRFAGLPAGEQVVVTVSAKNRTFDRGSLTFGPMTDVVNADFVAR